jgi:hypothetical protein
MERLELEGKQTNINPQNIDNKGNFRRLNNNSPQIIQREPWNRDRDDQKIQTPPQNNLVADDGGEEEDLDPEIHCLEDASPSPHLTQSTYEESLMDIQLNELIKGNKANNIPNRYNLRSKEKDGKSNIPDHPPREDKPDKDTTNNSKEKKAHNPPLVAKGPIPKVKEIPKPPSYFTFEHEFQKIRILVPLSEMVKHKDFKRSLSKLWLPEPLYQPSDSINLQDEKPTIILGRMVEDKNDSSPPFYTSLNIHDKVLYNYLMDSSPLIISCPKLSWKN